MITYREALAEDLPSMSTIVGRAFKPEALPMMFPNTAAMRQWWESCYELARNQSTKHLLVAVDIEVIGVFTMSADAPIIAAVPLTKDHGFELAPALEELEEKRPQGHYLVELVAVDKAYQGRGIGKKLTQWACDIVDAQDMGISVQTSAAKDYYLNQDLGFLVLEEEGAGGALARPKKSTRLLVDDQKTGSVAHSAQSYASGRS